MYRQKNNKNEHLRTFPLPGRSLLKKLIKKLLLTVIPAPHRKALALHQSCTWLTEEAPEEQQRAERLLFLLGWAAGALAAASSSKSISSVAGCCWHWAAVSSSGTHLLHRADFLQVCICSRASSDVKFLCASGCMNDSHRKKYWFLMVACLHRGGDWAHLHMS